MDVTLKAKKNLPWRGGLVLFVGCASIIVVAVLLGKWAGQVTGIGINTTPSEPLGFYRYSKVVLPLTHAQLVVVNVPKPLTRNFRRYVPEGIALIKRVGALPGDRLTTVGQIIWRCSHDKKHCVVLGRCLIHDHQGSPLHCQQYHDTVVPKGKVYLASQGVVNAYDSRYFGWVSMANVQHIARPILTWR